MISGQLSKNEFGPGEKIEVVVNWKELPKGISIDVRLVWYTEGKGTRDHLVVQSQSIPRPGQTGSQPIQFDAPHWPLSFSGQLISLRWAVEIVELPSEEAQQLELVIGPQGRETLLPVLDEPLQSSNSLKALLRQHSRAGK
jgi:hypothetical protein